jgi:hypothetical protein
LDVISWISWIQSDGYDQMTRASCCSPCALPPCKPCPRSAPWLCRARCRGSHLACSCLGTIPHQRLPYTTTLEELASTATTWI